MDTTGTTEPKRDLFEITGVTKQRDTQCGACPDGRSKVEIPHGVLVRAHRCHDTPDALCAGPNRPKLLPAAVQDEPKMKVERHTFSDPDEVAALLNEIHKDVQGKIHDQWDWMDASFYTECLRCMVHYARGGPVQDEGEGSRCKCGHTLSEHWDSGTCMKANCCDQFELSPPARQPESQPEPVQDEPTVSAKILPEDWKEAYEWANSPNGGLRIIEVRNIDGLAMMRASLHGFVRQARQIIVLNSAIRQVYGLIKNRQVARSEELLNSIISKGDSDAKR